MANLYKIPAIRMDSEESVVFFQRELEQVLSKVFDQEYPEMTYTQVIPISREIDPGATTIVWQYFTKVGMAKIIANGADDIPMVDVWGQEKQSPVRTIADGWMYTSQEVRTAQKAGRPLDAKRAMTAREVIERTLNYLAYFGDAATGIPGFLNAANITTGSVTNGAWATQSADNILADMNASVEAMLAATNQIERPDTMLLPPTLYGRIATLARSANSDTTVLQYFLKNSPWIKSIIPVPECSAAINGVAGVNAWNPGLNDDYMVIYRKDPSRLEFHIPMPTQATPPFVELIRTTTALECRCGGTIVYKPLSVGRFDNI